jgi:hypothetical protein
LLKFRVFDHSKNALKVKGGETLFHLYLKLFWTICSNHLSTSTNAAMDSATGMILGARQQSWRPRVAISAFLPDFVMVLRDLLMEGTGFMPNLIIISSPVEIPPRIPPDYCSEISLFRLFLHLIVVLTAFHGSSFKSSAISWLLLLR